MSNSGGEFVTVALTHDGGREVTVYVPPAPVDSVVYAADGAWHIAALGRALAEAGNATTMIVGVHGRDDDAERAREYVPGVDAARFELHERFVVDEVRGWTAARFGVAPGPERTAVWGASFGGEFALACGIRNPDVYGAMFSASPGAGYAPPSVLPSRLPRCYLVAGTREPFFLANARRWADALPEGEAVMTERDGDHGDAFWAEEFPLMIDWAFGH